MIKGNKGAAWITILTLLFWTLLPAAGLLAVTRPTITVTTPSNNLVTDTPSVNIQGYVIDAATLDIDNVRTSFSPNGYFSYNKTLEEGINSIVVSARNSAGLTNYNLTVIYDPAAVSPTIVSTTPTTVSTPTPKLTGTVSNNVYFYYTVNGGIRRDRSEVNGPFDFTVPTPLNLGDNTIILTVSNGTRVVNQPIHIRYISSGPEITNISPENGDKVTTQTVDFSGVVTTNVGQLEVLVNGTSVGYAFISSNGNFLKEDVPLNPGDNTVSFVPNGSAIDTKSVNVRYEVSPIVVVTSPKNYDIVTSDSVVITGKVFNTETNGLTVNDKTVSFNSDGTFSKRVYLDKIENTIKVKAANGSMVNTADLMIYYSGIPRINIDYPTSGDTVNTADIVFKGSVFPTDHISGFTITGSDDIGAVSNLSKISGSEFLSRPVTLDPAKSTDVVFELTTEDVTTETGIVLASRTVTRTITINSNVGPVITVSSPEDGATVYSNTVTVYGLLDRADVNSLKVDGTSTKVRWDGTFSQTVTLRKGRNDIKIEAKLVDDKDKTTSKIITIYYDSIAAETAVLRTKMTDGREIKAFNDMVRVRLPKGSVGLNTTSVLAVADQDDCENIPAQSALVGPVISVGWNGDYPLTTYKVTLKYDDVVRDNQAHKVSVFHYDKGSQIWTVLGGVVDYKTKTVSIETKRTGYFAPAIYFKTFDDVTRHWGQRDIEYLVSRGAIPLNTTYLFHPDKNITRAEFVMFLVKAMGIQRYHPSVASYADVAYNSNYYDYIEAALRAGLVSGISHNTFAPDQNLTREEASAILARAGNMKVLKEPDIIKILSQFTDEDSISPWARNQLAAAVKAKVLNGFDNTFKPQGKTTRAEAAAMIVRLAEILNKTRR